MYIGRRFVLVPITVVGENKAKAEEAAVRFLDRVKDRTMPIPLAIYGVGWHVDVQGKFASILQSPPTSEGQYAANGDQRLT